MKKTLSKLISIIVLLILIIACKSKANETINAEQLDLDYPVSFRMDKSDNQIFRINFRIPFEISSGTSKKYKITSLDYYYNNKYSNPYKLWLANVLLYNSKNNERITDNYLEFNKENPAYIYIYTMHSLDTTAQTQLELKPYIDKMIELGQDTLSIPSFNEFKKEHPQLVKDLLQGDSISVLIKKDFAKNSQLLGDTVLYVPIKY